MSEPRRLQFATIDDALAEIARLRSGKYTQLRNWNLPMMARHVGFAMERFTHPPTDPVPTPEQAARKAAFVDVILKTRRPPVGVTPSPDMIPPPDCGEADVDRLVAGLERLKVYPHPMVAMGQFGPVSTDEFRQLNLFHIAHHLSLLIPA